MLFELRFFFGVFGFLCWYLLVAISHRGFLFTILINTSPYHILWPFLVATSHRDFPSALLDPISCRHFSSTFLLAFFDTISSLDFLVVTSLERCICCFFLVSFLVFFLFVFFAFLYIFVLVFSLDYLARHLGSQPSCDIQVYCSLIYMVHFFQGTAIWLFWQSILFTWVSIWYCLSCSSCVLVFNLSQFSALFTQFQESEIFSTNVSLLILFDSTPHFYLNSNTTSWEYWIAILQRGTSKLIRYISPRKKTLLIMNKISDTLHLYLRNQQIISQTPSRCLPLGFWTLLIRATNHHVQGRRAFWIAFGVSLQ